MGTTSTASTPRDLRDTIDNTELAFSVRWNYLIRHLLVESSVKLVARTVMDYANYTDGSRCFPSIKRLQRDCGLSDKTVRNAWAVLRGLGLATRTSQGNSFSGKTDSYQLNIPENWSDLPTTTAGSEPFTCLSCGEEFDPPGHVILSANDQVSWVWGRFVFCSYPTGTRGNWDCVDEFDAIAKERGSEIFEELTEFQQRALYYVARAPIWRHLDLAA